jgi:hypothetical protein
MSIARWPDATPVKAHHARQGISPLAGPEGWHCANTIDAGGIFPEFQDGYGILCLPTTGRYYQVPFGITVPQDTLKEQGVRLV